jgi:hypothetical protein
MHSEKCHALITPAQSDSKQQHFPVLLSEQVPEVQPLRIHQEMIDCQKIGNTNCQGHHHVNDCHAHRTPSLDLADIQENLARQRPRSAGALNTGEPIKKPQTHGTGNVENHLADSNFYFAIRRCRGHCNSFSPDTIFPESAQRLS